MTSACVDLRRARPLLGTVVDIAVTAPHRAGGHAAIDEAFAAVAQVHRLMSFHEPGSDVSRLNRDAARAPVAVHPWTIAVLEAAAEFRGASAGHFDVSIARHLEARGILPSLFRHAPGCSGLPRETKNIVLLPGDRVRFSSSEIRIDLGGIAKGFAVDRAVDVLRGHGIVRGVVNAGGDLFAFGASHTVDLRDPCRPAALLGRIAVAGQALASSARSVPGAAPSLIVDPGTGRAGLGLGAAVLARDGMTADALTKLVVLLGREAGPILARYGASALFAAPDGVVHVTDGWPEMLRHAA